MAFKKFKKLVLDEENLENPSSVLRVINQLQTNIEEAFTPLVERTQNDSIVLMGIPLVTGRNNIVSHTLGRKLQGWKLARLRAPAQVWDTQDLNKSPTLSLWLSCSADVVVDIEVF